jgi:hypothetical protein
MPARFCMPLADWPAPEREAWHRAVTPKESLYDEGGTAAELRPGTIETVAECLGHWLAFLATNGWLSPVATPMDRVTPTRLNAFIAAQQARGNGPRTISGRVEGLADALRWMQPGRDTSAIRRPGGISIRQLLGSVTRDDRIVDSLELQQRAVELRDAGMSDLGELRGRLAVRDAALLGVLAILAPRVRELSALRLGEHLREVEGGYRLDFPGKIAKTRRGRGSILPGVVAGLIDDYLRLVRPSLAQGSTSDHLWLNRHGGPLAREAIQDLVGTRTEEWLGERHGPQWFRKCLSTTSALRGPDFAWDTALVMGHTPRVALKHYNKATALEAADRHGERIARLRAKTAPLAASFFKERSPRGGAGRESG